MNENQKSAAQHALEAAIAIAQGRYIDAVRHSVEGALDLATPDVVRQVVTDAMVRRANAIADAVETERFGKEQ